MVNHGQHARELVLHSGSKTIGSKWDLSRSLFCRSAGLLEQLPRAEVFPRQFGNDATGCIANFCANIPATRVVPNQDELSSVWVRCSTLQPTAVANAICAQFATTMCSHAWQPQLRALHLLTYLYSKDDSGRAVAKAVMTNAGELVRHLATRVPECREEALAAIFMSQQIHIANEGGLNSHDVASTALTKTDDMRHEIGV